MISNDRGDGLFGGIRSGRKSDGQLLIDWNHAVDVRAVDHAVAECARDFRVDLSDDVFGVFDGRTGHIHAGSETAEAVLIWRRYLLKSMRK